LHIAATAPQIALWINDLASAYTSPFSQKEWGLAGASFSPSAHSLDSSQDAVPDWKAAKCELRDVMQTFPVVDMSSYISTSAALSSPEDFTYSSPLNFK
jgi:hypothetical protein